MLKDLLEGFLEGVTEELFGPPPFVPVYRKPIPERPSRNKFKKLLESTWRLGIRDFRFTFWIYDRPYHATLLFHQSAVYTVVFEFGLRDPFKGPGKPKLLSIHNGRPGRRALVEETRILVKEKKLERVRKAERAIALY